MEWLIFRLDLRCKQCQIAQCKEWYDAKLRDRFDDFPCRDCDVPEGMWW
jgi:hypothetical protein